MTDVARLLSNCTLWTKNASAKELHAVLLCVADEVALRGLPGALYARQAEGTLARYVKEHPLIPPVE